MFKQSAPFVNPMDLVAVFVVLRALYIGWAGGSIVELFKLSGTAFAAVVALHFYPRVAQGIAGWVLLWAPVAPFLALVILWGGITALFKLVREGWEVVLPRTPPSSSLKIGGMILGGVRGTLAASLTFLAVMLAGHPSLERMGRTSMSRVMFAPAAVDLYRWVYDAGVRRFFPDERINEEVFVLIGRGKRTHP